MTNLPTDIPIITVPDCRLFLSHASAGLAGNPSERLTVIAVTGTNGKTTVSHFIGQLLMKLGVRVAVIGTTGIFIDGVKIDYECAQMTTLPAEYLHPLLKVVRIMALPILFWKLLHLDFRHIGWSIVKSILGFY